MGAYEGAAPEIAGDAVEQFDHHSEYFAEHWREQYAEMRGTCPVAHTEAHGGYFVATRYEDVKRVLQDPATFACGRDLELEHPTAGHVTTGGVTIPVNPVQMGMMETDPPRSLALRRILAARFSAKAIKEYRPRMAEITTWLVDRVIESGRIDFVDDLANPLPALVSLDYFGLALEKWEYYATVLHRAAYREKGSGRDVRILLDDLRSTVEQRAATLGDRDGAPSDVVDRLLNAEIDGVPMGIDEAVNQLFMLLNGGIDTSTALIAAMFLHLDDHPEQRAALTADPALIPAAVDEMLRYFSPATALARTVVAPVELGGVVLAPGDRVLLGFGAANGDPEVFPEPDDVVLDRHNSGKHLAFGYGIHRCIGAFIAPAELIELLGEVLRRMPDYTIDRSTVVPYPTIPAVNGYIAMPATFTPGRRLLTGFDADLPVRGGISVG